MNRMRAFKITTDDWHPSFKMDERNEGVNCQYLVEVSMMLLTDGQYRCCVWGADDFGLEFDNKDKSVVMDVFISVLEMKDVTINKLRKMGFEIA